jgi:integrase
MTSTKGPARGTFIVSGRYYLVRADGKRRVWIKLTRVSEGLPAFYAALAAELAAPVVADDLMPKVIAAWERDVMSAHAEKTQRDERARGRVIAEEFDEFRACDMRPQDIAGFLQQFRDRPKTHNLYRAQIGELMRFAIERGWREPGSNPVVGVIRTMPTPPRGRYLTDSEVRRIKVAGCYGLDGKRTRSGLMLAALVDMAYLTGQRIADLLALQWGAIGDAGITFRPEKTAGSTGAQVLIGWTPKLVDVVRRLREMRRGRRVVDLDAGAWVFTTQSGRQAGYWGMSSAWRRACERAGIKDAHFHDLRAKALTDTEEQQGMQAARRKGAHSTEGQTADYIRHRKPQVSRSTR